MSDMAPRCACGGWLVTDHPRGQPAGSVVCVVCGRLDRSPPQDVLEQAQDADAAWMARFDSEVPT